MGRLSKLRHRSDSAYHCSCGMEGTWCGCERMVSDVCLLSLERDQTGGLKPASSLGVVWLNLCIQLGRRPARCVDTAQTSGGKWQRRDACVAAGCTRGSCSSNQTYRAGASPLPLSQSCFKGEPNVRIARVILQICPQPNAPK